MHRPHLYPAVITFASLALSLIAPIATEAERSKQNFIITAYYSPLPDQKRFALGSYQRDIAFNGRGIMGYDETPVYPGMIAAPPEVPFDSRIVLPKLDVVGTVHDRGGWIKTEADGTMRIDLWMGHGEEGLARALEFGVQRMSGVIVSPGKKNLPAESFTLEQFPAPLSAIAHLPVNPIVLRGISDPVFDETSAEVAAIQHILQKLGYLDHAITSYYGYKTKNALKDFQRDNLIAGDGSRADNETREALIAHRSAVSELESPLASEADAVLFIGKRGREVRVVQRLLSLLGKYDGDIDGIYDSELREIVLSFQRERDIVSSRYQPGAGMVGPLTRRALLTSWRSHRIAKRSDSVFLAYR